MTDLQIRIAGLINLMVMTNKEGLRTRWKLLWKAVSSLGSLEEKWSILKQHCSPLLPASPGCPGQATLCSYNLWQQRSQSLYGPPASSLLPSLPSFELAINCVFWMVHPLASMLDEKIAFIFWIMKDRGKVASFHFPCLKYLWSHHSRLLLLLLLLLYIIPTNFSNPFI